jgi:hypothetical protein
MKVEMNRDEATAVVSALVDQLPPLAQVILDKTYAVGQVGPPEWSELDDLAGHCRVLAWTADVAFRIAHRLDRGAGDRS